VVGLQDFQAGGMAVVERVGGGGDSFGNSVRYVTQGSTVSGTLCDCIGLHNCFWLDTERGELCFIFTLIEIGLICWCGFGFRFGFLDLELEKLEFG